MKHCGRNPDGHNQATADEVRFIRQLGLRRPRAERLKLLKGYIHGLSLHKRWGGIDKGEVLLVAWDELEKCGGVR